jgi:hypothetical protein
MSSKGSRAARSLMRTVGINMKASASLSGPRKNGARAARSGASAGFRPEATWISPESSRAAADQEVGPWIKSPLRSAIPPRRRT